MNPRRGQPPLFEALGESPRRDGSPAGPVVHPAAHSSNGHPPALYVPPAPRAPVVVESPAGHAGRSVGLRGNRTTVIAFLAAAVVILFMIVWSLAYKLGERQGQESVLSHTDPEDARAITGQDSKQNPTSQLPVNAPSPEAERAKPRANAVPPATPKPTSTAAAGLPPVAQADPRIPGNNYLELCPLTWKDAEPAVRYLQAHGVRATAIPNTKKVDPAKPEPNNPFLIIVDQPYASGNFKATQAERNALVAEIRRLGKKWQAEHRGASDFADPMWRLQKGK
jgi:hypothetical protein